MVVSKSAHQKKIIYSPLTTHLPGLWQSSGNDFREEQRGNQGREENNKCGRFLGAFWLGKKKNAATLLTALLAAPSTGLPEYLRTASAREISSVIKTPHLPQTQPHDIKPSCYPCVRTHCIQECPHNYYTGRIPYVNPRCCRRCQSRVRCGACLVTGRPVWSCNNLTQFAHAPDSMLVKVQYK